MKSDEEKRKERIKENKKKKKNKEIRNVEKGN